MCTALTYRGQDLYLGRTLDYEHGYGEEVTVTPRRFPLPYRHGETRAQHYAFIGMAAVTDGYPLYYDGVNEHGLCIAALRFAEEARYAAPATGADNVAVFELIPRLLGDCRTLEEARAMLTRIRLVDTPFSAALPTAPLHWLMADRRGAVTVESTADGLHVYDNPVEVLTNSPAFPQQLERLGGDTLPGDGSSPSRFIRGVFTRSRALTLKGEGACVGQVFHIMGAVEQVKGCRVTAEGYHHTLYTVCYNADRGISYLTTYGSRRIRAVSLHRGQPDGDTLSRYPLPREEDIGWLN